MASMAKVWDERAVPTTHSGTYRLDQYEAILGQIATGVFILEERILGRPESLEVTFVNEMAARFFGRTSSSNSEVLLDAHH
ncbi:MAG: PAS domain-containing protein [Actinomycetota bacterium]